jgi:aldehyde dehydrogenase (NAD+)
MTEPGVASAPRRYDAFVGGAWRPGHAGARYESVNPSTGAVIAQVTEADGEDVDGAVRDAAQAFGSWRSTSPAERGRVLAQIAERMREEVTRLAELEVADNGMPRSQAVAFVLGAARYFEYYAGMADKLGGDTIPLGDGYVSYTRHEPHGVIGAILPWNAPINQAARTIAPAIMMGNTVVAKPAEQTPLTCLELAAIAYACGLPAGVLNVVPGFGPVAGAALVDHPLVRKLTFTGSVETGRVIAARAGSRLIPASLELGGKSAHIIFADADLDAAARDAWGAISQNAGQICSAGSRLLVERSVYDDVVEQINRLSREITIGPGSDDPGLASLVSDEQKERVERYVALAEEEGAIVSVGGAIEELPPGPFVRPAVISGATNQMRVAREEIFGPVLVVIPFNDENDAIALANDSSYGLVAGIWTNDLARAHRVAGALEVGQVFVNQYYAGGVETPFGGVKDSGYGRSKGVAGALVYTYLKTVTIKLGR